MSQIFVRLCCDNKKTHIGFFSNEPPLLFCKKHIQDEILIRGAEKIIEIPLEESQ